MLAQYMQKLAANKIITHKIAAVAFEAIKYHYSFVFSILHEI